MSDISLLLIRLRAGDSQGANELLPLVYDELRKLAQSKLSRERPGQTLQATALVHEAWLRIIGSSEAEVPWDGQRHFFAAAAEAMRRILVEQARRKARIRHGGEWRRRDLNEVEIEAPETREDLVKLDIALSRLAQTDRPAAELVKLRYFAGMTVPEAAEVLDISPRSADRLWSYARAFLHQEMIGE